MSSDFFQSKKPWSPYKDMILSYYLTPYLPKVCSLGKPVVVVDCFAGPGRFEDGSEGSPLIISKAVREMVGKGKAVSAVFIEEKRKYFTDICMDTERNEAEIQAEGVFNQRIQNLALALNKV